VGCVWEGGEWESTTHAKGEIFGLLMVSPAYVRYGTHS